MPDDARSFRWRRFEDGSGEEWSEWHAKLGPCASCCCGGVRQCAECSGREHQEAGEPVSTFDAVHITYCQGCGEDLLGERVEVEDPTP